MEIDLEPMDAASMTSIFDHQSLVQYESRPKSFSIGICASDHASNLSYLLEMLENEEFPRNFVLKRIIVVMSGCSNFSLALAREFTRKDEKIVLIEESKRYGKAEAINRIIENLEGDFLVFVNSDALPDEGSIQRLLESIDSSKSIGSVSAAPTFEKRTGTTSEVLDLMWSAHNLASLRLNHARLSNHNCDELMVVRTDLLNQIPEDIVNDGAYIGGLVHLKGYLVNFSDDARVLIDLPSNIYDLVQQRRRILYGHAQVWKRLGNPPRTLESLLVSRPEVALGILSSTAGRRPRLLLALVLAVVCEGVAGILSLLDRLKPPSKHIVWRRYGHGE